MIELAFGMVDDNDDGVWDGEEVYDYLLDIAEALKKEVCTFCNFDEDLFIEIFDALAREIGDKDEIISIDDIRDLKKQLSSNQFKLSDDFKHAILMILDVDKDEKLTIPEIIGTLGNMGIDLGTDDFEHIFNLGFKLILRILKIEQPSKTVTLSFDLWKKMEQQLSEGDFKVTDDIIMTLHTEIDMDKDGVISADDIIDFGQQVSNIKAPEDQIAKDRENLRRTLATYDQDGEPGISKDELKQLVDAFVCLLKKGISPKFYQ